MINRSILVGRLTKVIELRKTPNGASVAQFTLACNRRFKQDGQPDADFINCVAWNKTAEILNDYTQKGSQIGVEGRIQTRSYDDKDGKRVYITEVVCDSVTLLESKQATNNQGGNTYAAQTQNNAYNQNTQELDINSDDLPF